MTTGRINQIDRVCFDSGESSAADGLRSRSTREAVLQNKIRRYQHGDRDFPIGLSWQQRDRQNSPIPARRSAFPDRSLVAAERPNTRHRQATPASTIVNETAVSSGKSQPRRSCRRTRPTLSFLENEKLLAIRWEGRLLAERLPSTRRIRLICVRKYRSDKHQYTVAPVLLLRLRFIEANSIFDALARERQLTAENRRVRRSPPCMQ